ncbi:hypothetical protein D3C83_48000 [compost metagenome]
MKMLVASASVAISAATIKMLRVMSPAGAMTSSTGRRASSKAIVSPLVEAIGKLAA